MASTRRFTLTELLVTMAIVAVIMGISVAALRRAGTKDEIVATQQAVRALFRRARNAAREERYAVTVEVDAEASELRAYQKTTVTQFHLEAGVELAAEARIAVADTPPPREAIQARFEGAKGYELYCEDAAPVAGKVGQGLLFEKSTPEGAAWAWVPHRPALMPREGLHFGCWIYLGDLSQRLYERRSEEPRSPGNLAYERAGAAWREAPPRLLEFDPADPPYFVIARKGRAFGLAVTADYELEVAITGGLAASEVTYLTRTRPHTLRPDRWYRLELGFDGRQVRIVVDGIGRQHLPIPGQEKLPATLLRDPAPLSLSDPDPRRALFGVVDEVRLGAIVSSTRVVIPKDITLITAESRLQFDLLGQLDPAVHAEPFVLYLCSLDGLEERLNPQPQRGEGSEGQGRVKAGQTRTRAEQGEEEAQQAAAGALLIGRPRFEKFLKLLGELQERQVKRVMVDRTGLVSE